MARPQGPLYRRVFSCASIGLSYGAASVTYHSAARELNGVIVGGLGRDLMWTALVPAVL